MLPGLSCGLEAYVAGSIDMRWLLYMTCAKSVWRLGISKQQWYNIGNLYDRNGRDMDCNIMSTKHNICTHALLYACTITSVSLH